MNLINLWNSVSHPQTFGERVVMVLIVLALLSLLLLFLRKAPPPPKPPLNTKDAIERGKAQVEALERERLTRNYNDPNAPREQWLR